MSYCRLSNADIYLYSDVGGYINCQVCTLAPLVKTIFTASCEHCHGKGCEKCMMHGETHLHSPKDALEHVRLHREKGDFVPLYVDERLKEEIRNEKETQIDETVQLSTYFTGQEFDTVARVCEHGYKLGCPNGCL